MDRSGSPGRGDAPVAGVLRCFVEGPVQRPHRFRGDRAVEPEHALDRRPYAAHRPPLPLRVEQHHVRALAVRSHPCEQLHASAFPDPGRVGAGRQFSAHRGPPRGRAHGAWGEFERPRAARAHSARHGEHDTQLALIRREGEAFRVERKRPHHAPRRAAGLVSEADEGIQGRSPLRRGDGDGAFGRFAPEQFPQRHRVAGAEVDDPTAGDVPTGRPRSVAGINVRSVFVRHIRTVHAEYLQVGGRRRARMLAGVFAGREARLLRICRGVLAGEARNETVGHQFHRVAAHEVAHEQALSHEHGIVERTVVVRDVEFLEASVDPRQQHRLATHAYATVVARDPERRVRGGHQEVGGRGWGCR